MLGPNEVWPIRASRRKPAGRAGAPSPPNSGPKVGEFGLGREDSARRNLPHRYGRVEAPRAGEGLGPPTCPFVFSARRRRAEQPEGRQALDGLRARLAVELHERAAGMHLDRAGADEERLADLTARHAPGHEAHDLELAPGQAVVAEPAGLTSAQPTWTDSPIVARSAAIARPSGIAPRRRAVRAAATSSSTPSSRRPAPTTRSGAAADSARSSGVAAGDRSRALTSEPGSFDGQKHDTRPYLGGRRDVRHDEGEGCALRVFPVRASR